MAGEPLVPTNARVEADGHEPITLRLVRVPDVDGCRHWEAYGPPWEQVPPNPSLCFDWLPPKTGVSLSVWRGADGRLVFAPEPDRRGEG